MIAASWDSVNSESTVTNKAVKTHEEDEVKNRKKRQRYFWSPKGRQKLASGVLLSKEQVFYKLKKPVTE